MSYDGGMNFGLLGDYDALPDLDVVAEGIEGSLAELVAIARKQQRASKRRPAAKRPAAKKPAAKTPAAKKPRAKPSPTG